MNGATAQDVLCVYVPEGVALEGPIHVVYIPTGAAAVLTLHTLCQPGPILMPAIDKRAPKKPLMCASNYLHCLQTSAAQAFLCATCLAEAPLCYRRSEHNGCAAPAVHAGHRRVCRGN